jgi:hypothetical protein
VSARNTLTHNVIDARRLSAKVPKLPPVAM